MPQFINSDMLLEVLYRELVGLGSKFSFEVTGVEHSPDDPVTPPYAISFVTPPNLSVIVAINLFISDLPLHIARGKKLVEIFKSQLVAETTGVQLLQGRLSVTTENLVRLTSIYVTALNALVPGPISITFSDTNELLSFSSLSDMAVVMQLVGDLNASLVQQAAAKRLEVSLSLTVASVEAISVEFLL